MKITNELLDNWITEQVQLNEREYSVDDLFGGQMAQVGSDRISANAAYDTLARLKDPEEKLTDEDFQYLMDLIDIDPEAVNTDIERKLIAIKKSPTTDEDLKANAMAVLNKLYDKIEKTAKNEPQSVTQPQITTAKAEYGVFNSEIDNILNSIFSDAGDIKSRVEKLSSISKKYYAAAGGDDTAKNEILGMDKRLMLSEIMLMDYFAEISKSFDSGAGGYVFEYFLAMLVGGKVTGKQSGPGQGMGAVDFVSGNNTKGSAKWYAKNSNITQAPDGFNMDEPVNYIFGFKKQGSEQVIKISRGTSDPAKIMAVDMYYLQIKRITDTKFQIYRLKNDGSISGSPRVQVVKKSRGGKYGKLLLSQYLGDETYLDTVYISRVRTQTFRQMVHKAVSGENKQIIQFLENYVGSLRKAEASSKKYATSEGTVSDGQNAFDALYSAEIHMEEFVGALDPERVVVGEPSRAEIVENNEKITHDLLDKMIQRVILENK